MAEKQSLTIDGAFAASPDWATLLDRALDNVSRIVRSEMQELQTSIEAAVEAQVDNLLVHLATIATMVCGAICLMCAVILLLHQSLPWWQSFGLTGLGLVAAGMVSHAIMKPRQLGALKEE
jgi:hypothetical protein